MGAVKIPSYLTLNEWLSTNNIDVKINENVNINIKPNSINLPISNKTFLPPRMLIWDVMSVLNVILI